MIFLSITTKALALSLVWLHPRVAAGLWLAGLVFDLRLARGGGAKKSAGRRGLCSVAVLHVAALVTGWAAAMSGDYAAMRWKEGIPVFAAGIDGLLRLIGMSSGSDSGVVYLTTMAGPLEFAASLDFLAMKVPLLFLAMSAVWLLWSETPVREALRSLGVIAAVLIALVIVRAAGVVLLANALFDFVGYETEELPWRPFMDEAAGVWSHLPFLLAGAAIIGRLLPLPQAAADAASRLPRALRLAVIPLMALLALAVFWEPQGTRKQGKVVFSAYHAQWSRMDRPYDRDWYGADSGYNYACLRRLFGKFHEVAAADGPLTTADLADASVLVVYDPDRRFGKNEIELIHDFVRRGGGLLLIGDHTNVFGSTSHLNELCGPFGFRFRDDVLFDLDEDFHQLLDAPRAGGAFWHGISFFKLRGPASIRPTSIWTRNVYQVDHAKSVRAIYSVNNFYPPPHDHPRMKSGTFSVAAAARHGNGRVAAWADSTVFSNFEIFYPGKYEYLLNTLNWLDHRDGVVWTVGRRLALLVLLAGSAFLLVLDRRPRFWLTTLVALAACLMLARWASLWVESRRAEFPEPAGPSDWVVFAAEPDDPGHHLRDFISEEPYDQRYEVFIQWVLRTGAFPGFHLLGTERANGFYEHLRDDDDTRVARALIVRKPGDLAQLNALAAIPARPDDPLLLMFASSIPAEQAVESLKSSGILKTAGAAEQAAAAWPSGEVLIDDGGRRVIVVANAERFSDQVMGITEKVVPDENQRALFDEAFALIDRLFGKDIADR